MSTYSDDVNIYYQLAAERHGIPIDRVSREQADLEKRMTYARAYGGAQRGNSVEKQGPELQARPTGSAD